jgi:signal transduction histidine kinase
MLADRTHTTRARTTPSFKAPDAEGLRAVGQFALVAIATTLAVLFASSPEEFGTPFEILLLAVGLGIVIWLQVQRISLQQELRRARIRAVDAIDLERQRIERDLHDSAQQRLVCVRIHLGLLGARAHQPGETAAIERLERDLDAALADIRSVTRDGSPQLLLRNGVAERLRSAAAHTPLKVTVETDAFGRYPPDVERAVYFSCLEALQNVVKHAGSKAVARIRLQGGRNRISFAVEDSGVGFDLARVQVGLGLASLADRVGMLGGHLTVDSHPGLGTRILGDVPVTTNHRRSRRS